MNHTFNRLQISIVMVLILLNTIAVANAITSTSEEPLIVFEKIIDADRRQNAGKCCVGFSHGCALKVWADLSKIALEI